MNVLKWTARITSLAAIAIILMFIIGESIEFEAMAWTEMVMLIFFPIGTVVGMVVSWRCELTGGIVSMLSLGIFYFSCYLFKGDLPRGPYFLLFTSPAILFLIYGKLIQSAHQRTAADS